jgi:NADH dehydrogenase FAD-containing subunit
VFEVGYDKLVVAVGAYSQTFGIEGVSEHANFLRDVTDARRIRLKVLGCFEKAAQPTTSEELKKKLLHFAVVGGGPTGIEFAAELHDLVHEDLVKLYPGLVEYVGITVYDVAPKVLPMFDQALATYATEMFRRQGIVVKTEHHLPGIQAGEDGSLVLKVKEDGEVGAGVVVWSTGLMQNPLVGKLVRQEMELPHGAGDSPKSVTIKKHAKSGAMITDGHLRVQVTSADGQVSALPDVFALGDCAAISGQTLPATAQVASQQAIYLAKRFNKGDLADKPFRFRNWGTLTYLGSWKAIHQSSADELKGWAAWVLWRTAYLTRSMSIRNKIMVPVYWFMTWVFGRDISRF